MSSKLHGVSERFFFLFILFIFNNAVFAQNKTTQKITTERIIEIDFYRAIIEIHPTDKNQVIIEENVYDFDQYEKGKAFVPIKEVPSSISRSNNSLTLSNRNSRHLRKVIMHIPPELQIKVKVAEYGELKIFNLKNIIEAEIYQGAVNASIYNTLSVNVVRDGTISVNLKSSSNKRFLMLSGYDTDIDLKIEKMNSVVNIETELGTFNPDKTMKFEESYGKSFSVKNLKENKTEQLLGKKYSMKIGEGKDDIRILNIKGEISIDNYK